jgi:hypothetical protein
VSDADEFRKRAKECRQLAATVSDPCDSQFWLRLAEDWMNIALVSETVKKARQRGSRLGCGFLFSDIGKLAFVHCGRSQLISFGQVHEFGTHGWIFCFARLLEANAR